MRNMSPFVLAAAWLCSAPSLASDDDPTPPEPLTSQALYRVGPGDGVAVRVYGEDSLTGTYPVSPSGELDFPLIGEVKVEGLTSTELSALLRERLTQGYLNNPYVTVSVATHASQPVQVLGAVRKPGMYYLQGPTTVLQVLSMAGGVENDGVNEVRITRGGLGGDTLVHPYEQLLSLGANATAIESGDVVFVPQSIVSVMGSVSKPGELTFREGLTLSRAIALVGGAHPTANLRKVYVLRGEQRIVVNVRKVMAGKEKDLPLQVGDRVVIEESVF